MLLRHKILARSILATMLIILAMSGLYYAVFTRDIRERSRQTVATAFEVVFDDVRYRLATVETHVRPLTQQALPGQMYSIAMLQATTALTATDEALWNLKKIFTYANTITRQLTDFAALTGAVEIQVYQADRQLLAVYHEDIDGTLTGVRLPIFQPDQLIPFKPQDRWHALLQHVAEIPFQQLPSEIPLQYAGEIPTTPVLAFSALQQQVTMSLTAPILDRGTLQGICRIYLAFRPQDVARYAHLSGTQANVFAGTTLNVGTLSAYQSIVEVEGTPWTLNVLNTPPSPEFATVAVDGLSYYQGILPLGDSQTTVGAISILYPRQLEAQQKTRLMWLIGVVALVFIGFAMLEAFGLTNAILRPLNTLMITITAMEQGDLNVQAKVVAQDEIGRLAAAFNTMTAQIQAGFNKIEQQNRELHQLDKLKDEFLANTSHELRTPLHGIAGLAEAMLSGADGPLTEEERKHTRMILQSSRRLGELVSSLLDFSKVRSEGIQLHRKPFPLAGVVDVVASFSQELLSGKPVTLHIDIPDDLPEIYGDLDRVEQILTNLVGNAIKFTRAGTITIVARPHPIPLPQGEGARESTSRPPLLEKEGEQERPSPCGKGAGGENSWVQITITDTGIGIPAEALERIFQPFEQVDGSATREFGGTGLGLAITKELVELHGGEIQVESIEDQGSTFTVLLPCGKLTPRPPLWEREGKQKLPSPSGRGAGGEVLLPSPFGRGIRGEDFPPLAGSERGAGGEVSGQGRTILVIDDDATNVEVLRAHLEQAGFSVMTAFDGQHAFEVINGFEIDLILCDVMMPIVDGYTFATRVRANERLRDIPLVFVSAKDRTSDMLRGYQAGGIEYITKPIDRETLLLKITAILDQQQRVRERYVPTDAVRTSNHVYDTNGDKEDAFTHVPEGHGERILVVDDEPINIEVYQAHLTQHGYTVLAAANGPEALDMIDREQPDLVLLDLMMPKMSGFRVCQILRQEKHLYHLPIIMLTAKSHIYDKVYGLNVGANDYLVKPFHPDELLTRMSVLLSMVASQREALRNYELLHAEMVQRQQAEEEIRRLNEDLEVRVRQRTAELEAANRELKDFAYVVSHDLKAPLRGISHLVEWLTQDYAAAIDEKGREMADLLIGRVKRMDALIDGILAYSRVGRVEEYQETLDLNVLVNEVLKSLSLPDHIYASIAGELPVITADRTRMTQVFQNLLSNAVKFLDKPEGRIVVQADDDGQFWRFSVADNGPGIESKHYEHIFQIFQTLQPRDHSESTGVGLSIVKKIIELQGGRVWVESESGAGANFFFTVPKNDRNDR